MLEACRSAVVGRGAVLVVTGEPGIGKTALLTEAVRASEDWQVLKTTGVEAECAVGHSTLQALLWPLRHEVSALDEGPAGLLRSVLELGPALQASPFAVGAAVLTLLSVAADRRPVVVCVDDAQWADLGSQEVLCFVGRRIEHEPVSILAGVREGEPCLFAEERTFPQLRLEGLSVGAARELLERAFPNELDRGVADRLLDVCAGNPLGLLELPTLLSREERIGNSPPPSPVGAGPLVQQAFTARADRLGEDARRSLLLLAAAGDAEPSLLDRAGVTIDALDELEAAALVLRGTRVELRHPLVRAAVYGAAAPADRREAHRTLARVSEGARRVWHLAAGTEGTDDEVAQALEDVAGQARSTGGLAAEAQALERAAELSASDEERARRLLGAADAWRRAGRIDHAELLLDAALPLTDDVQTRASIQLVRANQLYHRYEMDAAYELASSAAEQVAGSDPGLASRLLVVATHARVISMHRDEALALAERARALAGESEEVDALSCLMATRMQVRTPPGAEDFELARRAGELLERPELRVTADEAPWVVYCLALHERDEQARSLSDLLLADARATGNVFHLTYRLCARAALEIATGRLDSARAFASENVALSEDIGNPFRLSEAYWILAEVESACGALAAAEQAFDAMIPPGNEWNRTRTLGPAYLALGRADDAIPVLERLAELTDEGASRAWFHHAPLELAEAYALAGRRRDAEALLRRETPGIESCPLARPRAKLARVRAVLAAEARIDVSFSTALALLQDVPHLLEEGRTELCWGESLRRAGRSADAAPHLERALARFDALGATGWGERTRAELEAATGAARPAQRRRSDVLTAQELRIARYAAAGLRDREIAATLYLSPRTVESHLQHAYRKLAVTNRTQLAAVLAADGVRPVQ